ncbi:MAG: PA2778 family cysteine peptidase [Solirubrobacterales bacterium]
MITRVAQRFAAGLLAVLVAACAGRETEALIAAPGRLPPAARVEAVPFYPQGDKACGPASLAMVLVWSGMSTSPDALSAMVYTPGREGSLASDLLGAARRQGRLAVPVHGLPAVLAEVAAGHPVLVFQNLGLEMAPVWHFAVAVGYDLPSRQIILNSGFDEGLRLPLDTFEHTWARSGRWAVVVLPADQLPATGQEADVVEAAAGLERAGAGAAAARAYEAVLSRWSGNQAAAIGLGNVRYAMGDLAGAEAAFRRATETDAGSAAAWNNLAHVLHEQGRRPEARVAATKAVELAGMNGAYAETWTAVFAE